MRTKSKEEQEEEERKRKEFEEWKAKRQIERWQEFQKGKVRLQLYDKTKKEYIVVQGRYGSQTFGNIKNIKQNFIFIALRNETVEGGKYEYDKLKIERIKKFDSDGKPVYEDVEGEEREEFVKWCKGYKLENLGKKVDK